MLSDAEHKQHAVRHLQKAMMRLRANVLLNIEHTDQRAVDRYLESVDDETIAEAREQLAIARSLICIANAGHPEPANAQ